MVVVKENVILDVKVFGNANQKLSQMSRTTEKMNGTMQTLTKTTDRFDKSGKSVGKSVTQTTRRLQRFNFEMLGVMFFGMAIARVFSQMLAPAFKNVGLFQLWSEVLGVLFLPIALKLLNFFLPFMTILLSLSPAAKEAVGWFALLGFGLGMLLFIVGTLALGFASLALVFNVAAASVAIFVGGIALVAAVIVGLIILFKNWNKISTKMKFAIFATTVAIALLLIPISTVAAVIAGVVAGIIIAIAIFKNWDKIITKVKDVFGALAEKFPILNTLVDGAKAAWNGFLNILKSVWDVMKSIGSAIKSVIGSGLKKLGNLFGLGGGGKSSGVSGSFQTGGFVPHDGLFKLHAGERVTQANNTTFAPTVNITSTGSGVMDIQRIKRELNETWRVEFARLARR